MNPNKFFIPNINFNGNYYNPQLMRINPIPPNNIGILKNMTNSLKSFNLNSFFNNASKTLNLMNQTIPIIKQTKPLINNIKSMFKLAKVFNNETSNKNSININKKYINTKKEKQDITNNNYPTFFI